MKASYPSVSIVVLNHNYERYVGEALASVVGQEPGDYCLAEIVVIDDGSTDRSHDVYARFPGVRVVRKAREGFGATLTRAVAEASGNWLAPLDADDTFAPDKLRTLAPHLADPARLLIQHASYFVDAAGRPLAEGTDPGGSTSTLVVRTDAARDLLPVTNELFFHVLADLGHGICLPEPLSRYRVHEESMTDRRTPASSPTTWPASALMLPSASTSSADTRRPGQALISSPPWWRSTETWPPSTATPPTASASGARWTLPRFDLRQFDFTLAGLDSAPAVTLPHTCGHTAAP